MILLLYFVAKMSELVGGRGGALFAALGCVEENGAQSHGLTASFEKDSAGKYDDDRVLKSVMKAAGDKTTTETVSFWHTYTFRTNDKFLAGVRGKFARKNRR